MKRTKKKTSAPPLVVADAVVLGRDSNAETPPKKRSIGRPFAKGNSGRPFGARSKLTKAIIRDSRDAFRPLVDLGIQRGREHLQKCRGYLELHGCTACLRYLEIAMPYVYGKPVQRHELDEDTLRIWAASIVVKYGITMDEALQRVRETNKQLVEG